MTAITDKDYQTSMADAVRGKLAEAGCNTITGLAKILGNSRPTAASRFHGHSGYTVGELEKIANHLDISVYDINDSARQRVERRSFNDIPEAQRTTPPQDAWAQPARSKARRAS